MSTIKCFVCNKETIVRTARTQYCSRSCYDTGRLKNRSLVPPSNVVISGRVKYINGRIKVNEEYYDWLSQFAWQILGKGYVTTAVRIDKNKETTIRMHRLVMDAQPGQMIDHRNRDKLDNTIENLRFVNNSQNVQNTDRYTNAKNYYWWSQGNNWVVKHLGKVHAYCKTEREAIDFVNKYIKPLKGRD